MLRAGMRHLRAVAAVTLAMLAAVPATAQDEGNIDSTTFSAIIGSGSRVDPLTVNLDESCGKQIGCIVIANNSDSYNIVEVDVDVKTRIERRPRWTNILEEGKFIAPRKVFLIPRIGDDKLAVVALRAVVDSNARHDRQVIEIGTVDLRPDPQKRLFVNFLRFEKPPAGTGTASGQASPDQPSSSQPATDKTSG